MIKRKTRIHGGATNNYVCIPKAWLEVSGVKKGDEVITTLDIKNKKIIISFKKEV